MEIKVLNKQGSETGRTITLSESVFGISPNDHAIYLDVKQFLANQRQGTHKTKERKEIHRSTRKVIRQKGTGGARHGSLKAGIYVGGARIHGPRPRDYSFKLNKKIEAVGTFECFVLQGEEQQYRCYRGFRYGNTKDFRVCKYVEGLEGNRTYIVRYARGSEEHRIEWT